MPTPPNQTPPQGPDRLHALEVERPGETNGSEPLATEGLTFPEATLGLALPETGRALTPRESEVLGFVAAGLSTDQIAAKLTLSPETIKSHVANLMRSLQAQTRAQAVAIALVTRQIEYAVEA